MPSDRNVEREPELANADDLLQRRREKLTQKDAKQRSEEFEAHLPGRLDQKYYARAKRQRASPTNNDSTAMEDVITPMLREKRPCSDELQSAASRFSDDSIRASQRVVEKGPEHPKENHTAPHARLNPEDEKQVAEAYRILQTFRLPAHETEPNRRRHRSRPTTADHFGSRDRELHQETGTAHAKTQPEAPHNGKSSDERIRSRRNRLNSGPLRSTTGGWPAALEQQNSMRVAREGDSGGLSEETRRDEVITVHTNLAVPGARAEVTEEVESEGPAATAAINSKSSMKKKVRGKKKSGLQSRLSGYAQKRYRKEKLERSLASEKGTEPEPATVSDQDVRGERVDDSIDDRECSDRGGGNSGEIDWRSTERADDDSGCGSAGRESRGDGGGCGPRRNAGDGGVRDPGGADCGHVNGLNMDGASESRDLDGEPQPCHAARGDASDVTNENPKSCCVRSADGDEGGRAAKSTRQEGDRYGRRDIGGGNSGGNDEPMDDNRGSGSVSIHDRSGGDGSNGDGDARDGSGVRAGSGGCGDDGNSNGNGGVESGHTSGGHIGNANEDKDHDGETWRCLKHQTSTATAEEQEALIRRGSAPGLDIMDQFPEVCATRRNEVVTTGHTNLAVPGARVEVTEETAPGEAAAAAATKDMSGTRRRARGKKRAGQQSRLTRNARKRYKKEKLEKSLASGKGTEPATASDPDVRGERVDDSRDDRECSDRGGVNSGEIDWRSTVRGDGDNDSGSDDRGSGSGHSGCGGAGRDSRGDGGGRGPRRSAGDGGVRDPGGADCGHSNGLSMDGASESRDLDGEPQPCHAARGDASNTTRENPKSCGARSADGDESEPMDDDERSGSASIRNRAGGDGSNGDGERW